MNISNDTWFTYLAQIVNFLILVWLLRHFLYRPVLDTIQKREDGFVLREQNAKKSESEATELLATYNKQIAELEGSREEMMGQVRKEVSSWKSEQIEQAKKEVTEAKKRWHSAYQRDHEMILRILKERVGKEVQQIARLLLRELANCDLENMMIDLFLKHFAESPEGLSQFKSSASSGHNVRIRSAFPVSDDTQKRIITLLNGQTDSGTEYEKCELQIDADLICGIELVCGDHRWSWSFDQSLDELEQHLESLLGSGTTSQFAEGASR